jgi:broad specificity phosphatase PhoE
MRKTFPLFFILLSVLAGSVWGSGTAQEQDLPTTFILVRHAEKADDGTDDPHLTFDGAVRAEELAYMLNHIQLSAVYSTPFHRCRETAEPVARRQAKKVRLYQPNEQGFVDRVMKANPGGTVLIVGHSNTVPAMVNVLTGSEDYPWLHDSVYDNLFIVTATEVGRAKVLWMRFGAHTPQK